MFPTWVLIGAGRCGLQLARGMAEAGIEIVGVEVRTPKARARVSRALPGVPTFGPHRPLPPATGLLIAVPDASIADCASALAPRIDANTKVAVHTSGLVAAEALAPLAGNGRETASCHPLASFPTATGALVPLTGALAAIEGDPGAERAARWLARRLEMKPVRITAAANPRYHAAAVIASTLTHALVVTALQQLTLAGLSRARAVEGLRSLVGGSVAAALGAHGMERLTGPLARADAAAVRAHLAVLPAAAATAYRAVGGLVVAALTTEQLLSPRQVRELSSALTG
jgi:predicted short-subunit dehydrogenase-like oxidoreductase (DUF2520 family)